MIVAALNAGWTPSAEQLHQMFPASLKGSTRARTGYETRSCRRTRRLRRLAVSGSEDGYGEHSSGNAIDIMIPDYGGAGKQTGDQIASWIAKNCDAIGADGMIWRQTSWLRRRLVDREDDGRPWLGHPGPHGPRMVVILGKGRGAGAAKSRRPPRCPWQGRAGRARRVPSIGDCVGRRWVV